MLLSMKRICFAILSVLVYGWMTIAPLHAQKTALMDPVSLDDWIVSFGFGPGTPVFGNGGGFGPAAKVSFETGMWELGPGVLTLGGEAAFSFFSQTYGNAWRETWVNFMFGARSAYHYSWNVRGLDTYGGIPLGIGFSAYSHADHPGYTNNLPVYPYLGVFFGASWFFNRNIGINGEVGYNSTYANIGLVFKLN
jgi:hypothetical protein